MIFTCGKGCILSRSSSHDGNRSTSVQGMGSAAPCLAPWVNRATSRLPILCCLPANQFFSLSRIELFASRIYHHPLRPGERPAHDIIDGTNFMTRAPLTTTPGGRRPHDPLWWRVTHFLWQLSSLAGSDAHLAWPPLSLFSLIDTTRVCGTCTHHDGSEAGLRPACLLDHLLGQPHLIHSHDVRPSVVRLLSQ